MFTIIDKAITAFILPAVMPSILGVVDKLIPGTNANTTLGTLIGAAVAALGVYLVPNKKA